MGNLASRDNDNSFAQLAANEKVVGNFRIVVSPVIERGVFADVHKSYHKYRAMAASAKHYELLYFTYGERTKIETMFHNNLETMRKLQKHPNVVELYDYQLKNNSLWIFEEFCDQGDLLTYLNQHQELSLHSKIKIMKEVGSAIAHMHSQNPPIIHGDIKPGNIWIKTENGGDTAKIADFGISEVFLRINEVTREMVVCDTENYMAPELFVKYYENGDLEYTELVDIFSLGLVFLVTLQYESNNKQIKPKSVQGKKNNRNAPFGFELYECYGESITLPTLFDASDQADVLLSELQGLITNMTESDPEKRTKAKSMEINIMGIYERACQVLPGENISPVKYSLGKISRLSSTPWGKYLACQVLPGENMSVETYGTLSDLVQTEWKENKVVKVENAFTIRSVALIRDLLYCCCWHEGIHVYTQELEHVHHIAAHDMSAVRQVTELGTGGIVIAASTGLFHATHTGERSRIIAGWYVSVATHKQDVYAVRRDWSNSHASMRVEVYTQNVTWHARYFITLPCGGLHWLSIAVTDAHIYACCDNENAIHVISHDGRGFGRLGSQGKGGAGELYSPWLCHCDGAGAMLVADRINNRLQVMLGNEHWSIVDTQPRVRWPMCCLYTRTRLYVAYDDRTLRVYKRGTV